MNKTKCKHLSVTFLGMQETNVPGKQIALYNCDKCGSTISIPIINVRHSVSKRKKAFPAFVRK